MDQPLNRELATAQSLSTCASGSETRGGASEVALGKRGVLGGSCSYKKARRAELEETQNQEKKASRELLLVVVVVVVVAVEEEEEEEVGHWWTGKDYGHTLGKGALLNVGGENTVILCKTTMSTNDKLLLTLRSSMPVKS